MSLLNEISNDVAGYQVLLDWLGDGGHPVSQDTANTRAMACLHGDNGNECPYLTYPDWWEKQKGRVASAIKDQLEAKGKLKLETALDKNSRMCSVCGCCASLKVWTPIQFIKSHTSDEVAAKFPPHCWIRQEIENL